MKFPRSLRSAMSESSKVLEHCGKIRQAISKAEKDRQAFGANMTDIQQRLAGEEAEAALSDHPSAAPGPARKALSAARDQEAAIEARIVGLEARLAESDDGLLAAQRIFASVYGEFCEQRLAQIESEWDQMIEEQIVPFLRRSIAEVEGFGRRATGARKAEFRCVASIEAKQLAIVPESRGEYGDRRESLLDDRVMGKIHAEASVVGHLQDALYKEVTAVQKAAEARKVAEDAAGFEEGRQRSGGGIRSARMGTPFDHVVPKNEISEGGAPVVYEGGRPMPGSSQYGAWMKAAALHEQGLSIEQIAEKLEWYPSTIRGWIEAAQRRKEKEKAMYQQAIALDEQGLSIGEIARKLDYFEATIQEWLKTAAQEKEQEKATAEAGVK